jgi:hypothetical protein
MTIQPEINVKTIQFDFFLTASILITKKTQIKHSEIFRIQTKYKNSTCTIVILFGEHKCLNNKQN